MATGAGLLMKESRMANSEGMPVVQLQQFAPQWVQLMLATLYGEPCKVGRASSLFGLSMATYLVNINKDLVSRWVSTACRSTCDACSCCLLALWPFCHSFATHPPLALQVCADSVQPLLELSCYLEVQHLVDACCGVGACCWHVPCSMDARCAAAAAAAAHLHPQLSWLPCYCSSMQFHQHAYPVHAAND
jgi:hypothetical protein